MRMLDGRWARDLSSTPNSVERSEDTENCDGDTDSRLMLSESVDGECDSENESNES